jgi:cobalamin biosynthetic protein CobC
MKQDLVHGGALDHMQSAFPNAPLPWIDLSTGINPWPYPIGEISPDAFAHLPTRAAYDDCRNKMSDCFGAPPESLTLSPGSELLIRLLPDVIPAKRVAILSPTYGDHAQAWRAAGADVIESSAPIPLADAVDAVVVCNPNNPDGCRFAPEMLRHTARVLGERGGTLIVDEAYADLEPAVSLASHGGQEGLIVLRSFGKFFGLAGLRLGAMIAPARVCSAMRARLGVWPVAGPALAIGARAYWDQVWQAATREKLAETRYRLDNLLEQSGLTVSGGTDLFRLIETEDATRLWRKLAARGIYIRRFSWSDRLVRIGLPPDDRAEARLAAALSP